MVTTATPPSGPNERLVLRTTDTVRGIVVGLSGASCVAATPQGWSAPAAKRIDNIHRGRGMVTSFARAGHAAASVPRRRVGRGRMGAAGFGRRSSGRRQRAGGRG